MIFPTQLNQVLNVMTVAHEMMKGPTEWMHGSKPREKLAEVPLGLSSDELAEWVKRLQMKDLEPQLLDVAKLKVDMEELIAGTISTNRLKGYQDDELLFLCKSVTWRVKLLHEKLEE